MSNSARARSSNGLLAADRNVRDKGSLGDKDVARTALQMRRQESPLALGVAPAGLPQEDSAQLQVQRLTREIRSLEKSGLGHAVKKLRTVSAGCTALDNCLPNGGYRPGSVIEYLRTTSACGASYLAFQAAAQALRSSEGGYLVVVDVQHQFYPPALPAHGIDLSRVIFVRPQSQSDAIWSIDQCLRTSAVAAVVADLEAIDDRTARRLQLAAEQGEGLGFLVRSIAARRRPSWAEVQWVVRSQDKLASRQATQATGGLATHRRFQVQLTRVRGGKAGVQLQLEINSVTGALQCVHSERNRYEHASDSSTSALRLASKLASAKSASRRTAAG